VWTTERRLPTLAGDRTADRHHYRRGKTFLDMLGVFAEFETNLRRERQLEGIAKAKKAGVYTGRSRPSTSPR
jgi:DNA invertase Pin-like site-specific DNA recombinase